MKVLHFGTAKANALRFGIARAGHHKDTLPLSTARYCGLEHGNVHRFGHCRDALPWALQGYSAVGRCKNTLRLLLVTAEMFCGWALQGYVRILCGWALQGYSMVRHCKALKGYLVVGHCSDTPRLGTAGMLGPLVARHCRDTLRLGTAGILGG